MINKHVNYRLLLFVLVIQFIAVLYGTVMMLYVLG